jgi:5-methyltetrahydropteroyltriglutamate--homocysteine methyltransferase
MKAALPILPTSVVGSHAKMGWWYLMRQEAEAGRMGPRDVAEALDTAVDIAVLDQERAGLDVISDGEMRRLASFYRTYLRRIEGAAGGENFGRSWLSHPRRLPGHR